MITQLRGRLVEKSPTSVVIDCQGVGYLVNISLYTFGQLTDEENIQLYTHLQLSLIHISEPRDRSLSRMPSSA